MSKSLRPLWAVALTDELTMRRLAQGEELQRAVREKRSLADLRPLRLPSPTVAINVSGDAFSLDIVSGATDQIALGVVAQTLRSAGWDISNSYSQISFERILTQARRYGGKALLPGQHWYLRRYRSPIVVERTDQTYKDGFDAFVRLLESRVSISPVEPLAMAELGRLSEQAIGSTLPAEEARRYYMDRR